MCTIIIFNLGGVENKENSTFRRKKYSKPWREQDHRQRITLITKSNIIIMVSKRLPQHKVNPKSFSKLITFTYNNFRFIIFFNYFV